MIVLLPPSEGKSAELGKGAFGKLNPELLADTKPVLKHLAKLPKSQVGKFLGVKNPEKALDALEKDLAIAKAGCLPALKRYTGVVYGHLDYTTLKAKKRAASRLYVISGMFGLIAGGTQIPDYKLPMNPWLTKYWKDINTERIARVSKKKSVISLLSGAYTKAHGYEDVNHVDFKVQGGKKSAGHFGKAIKGRFARFLIENDVTTIADFDGFTEDDFRFDGANFVQD